MKKADECLSLQEVRSEIDGIDRLIVELLAKRSSYVDRAAHFKTDAASVRAEDRIISMLEKRKEWAVESGISPVVIENIYRNIVECFISEEMKAWKQGMSEPSVK